MIKNLGNKIKNFLKDFFNVLMYMIIVGLVLFFLSQLSDNIWIFSGLMSLILFLITYALEHFPYFFEDWKKEYDKYVLSFKVKDMLFRIKFYLSLGMLCFLITSNLLNSKKFMEFMRNNNMIRAIWRYFITKETSNNILFVEFVRFSLLLAVVILVIELFFFLFLKIFKIFKDKLFIKVDNGHE